jgi:hypothetical protein
MRILFVARHYTYFRNYDSALRELANRGHDIHLAVQLGDATGGEQAVKALAEECPRITFGEFPSDEEDDWRRLSRKLRLGLDYLRYLDPFYDDAPLRRVRARERTPQALVSLAEPPIGAGPAWRKRVGRWLHALDLAIPPPRHVVEFLQEQRPDILLITPLVDLGSQQIDFLRAARSLGIPTGLCVWSWDHLSSKAYLREYPERVFVWNETQRREALEVHGVPADRVVVTGAQCFDHWFERRPSRTREQLCAELGLPVDRPIILYVCTALIMGSPSEPEFIEEWLARVRASDDPTVATAGVLVRPHPAQMAKWEGVDLSRFGPVALWGSNPIDSRSRADYFDSLYHSAAVVGLNTSAFIEAGIVGRQVLAILVPRFHDNQQGTVHFKYLLQVGGGLLRVSSDLDTHLAQLSTALALPASSEHPHQAFLESFVRPGGLERPATPVFVQGVEALAGCTIAARDLVQPSRWRLAVLGALTRVLDARLLERGVLSPREIESAQRWRASMSVKERRRAQHMIDAAKRRTARERRIATEQERRETALRDKEQARQRKQALAAERAAIKQRAMAEHDASKRRAVENIKSEKQWRRRKAVVRARLAGVYRRMFGGIASDRPDTQ